MKQQIRIGNPRNSIFQPTSFEFCYPKKTRHYNRERGWWKRWWKRCDLSRCIHKQQLI